MNLRTPIICLTLLTVFNLANAQDDNLNYGHRYQRPQRNAPQQEAPNESPKGFVAVNTGFATVTGNWGFSLSPQYDGTYALSGSLQSISAGIPINGSNFGIALMIGLYDNPFDLNSFVQNVADADPNLNRGYGTLQGGDYATINFMAGLFYTYPVKRFSFDLRVMGGYINCGLPEIAYGAEQDAIPFNIQDTWDIASSSAGGFAYDVGVGARYSFRRSMCLMLNFDWLGASLPFKTLETHQNVDNNGNVTYDYPNLSGTVPVSLFNISLGLGFQFGR